METLTEDEITELTSSLAELLKKGAEYASPEKRLEYKGQVYREFMEATARLANEAVKSANGNSSKVRVDSLASRERVERKLREYQLYYPRTEEEFEAALKWMSERGGADDLPLLRDISNHPPYLSQKISELFEKVEQHISERVTAGSESGVKEILSRAGVGPSKSRSVEENDDLLREYHSLIDRELDHPLSDADRFRLAEINSILAEADESEAWQLSVRARELDNTKEMQELRLLNSRIKAILEAMTSVGNNEKETDSARF